MIRKVKNTTKKILKSVIFLLLLSSFLLLGSSNAISQTFGEKKRELKESIKQGEHLISVVFRDALMYVAIREDDLSTCDSLGPASEECRSVFNRFLPMRKIAENKCKEFFSESGAVDIPNEILHKIRSLCENINMDTCANEPEEGLRQACYGFKEGSLAKVHTGFNLFNNSLEGSSESVDDPNEDEVRQSLGIYRGLKSDRSQEACEEYVLGVEGAPAYFCEILFSKSPLDEILDGVVEDLTYFVLSEEYMAKYLCKEIKNINVQATCFEMKENGYRRWVESQRDR